MKEHLFSIYLLLFLIMNNNTISQWIELNGTYKTAPYFNTSFDKNENLILLGSFTQYFLISTDEGESWVSKKNLPGREVLSVKLINSSIFVGCSIYGMYKSTDVGNSWISVDVGIKDTQKDNDSTITDIVGNDKIMACRTYNGKLFVSIDMGNKWDEREGIYNPKFSNNNSIIAVRDSILLLGTLHEGVFKSIDKGITWEPINSEIFDKAIYDSTEIRVNSLTVFGDTLFAGINYNLYRSTNFGKTWENYFPQKEKPYSVLELVKINQKLICYYYYSTVINGSIMNYNKFFLSTDFGLTWDSIAYKNLPAAKVRCMGSFKNKLFVGLHLEDLYYSTDEGQTWQNYPENNNLAYIYSLNGSGTQITAGTDKTILYSTNKGQEWERIYPEKSEIIVGSTLFYGNKIFAGNTEGLFKSEDNGKTWNLSNKGMENMGSIRVFQSNGKLFAGSEYGGVFISEDNGENWVQKKNGIGAMYIPTIEFNGNEVYAGTVRHGVSYSPDLCENWTDRSVGIAVPYTVNKIRYITNNTLFAGTFYNSVFFTSDNGLNWEQRSNGIPLKTRINDIVYIQGKVILGTYNGVYISTDLGENWIEKNEGLSNLKITSLYYDDEYLYAGTYGNGIWKIKLSDILTSIKDNVSSSLFKIYPNPTSDKLALTQIPEGAVSYEIFDIFGERVLPLEAIHELPLQIDVSGLSSGVYFLKLNNQPPVKFIKI